MKDIDKELIDARPANEVDNERFVRHTITAVQHAQSHETFSGLMRTKSTIKKEKFMTKLLVMPKWASAALGLGVVIVTGGAAYAAINWFGADVKTSQNADQVYSIATECSPSLVQALKDDKPYTNTAEYKIIKPELISQDDFKLDGLATCEQRAIESNLRTSMPAVYQPGDSHEGLYYPVGAYGTVAEVSGNKITVVDIPVDRQTGPRENITATLTINPETLVTNQGKATDSNSLKQGDRVYFIFQNPVRPGQNDNDWRATPSDQSTIRALAKTQYDIASIKEKLRKATSEGAFIILKKSDAYGG